MSYQVIARRWRPQRFDDVVGQPAVTRTLRHAIEQKRVAQAFVFAGPRGVGKTTTARILARALNCVEGPTPDPCGRCEPCIEIAEGRDIDVLEIDAATHTGVDNVREVIIAGLAIVPVRNRYKVFIIDEVHQLSGPSFNALLKSIEEPPPHVVFMMATTELWKIPETVQSRAQVFEFRAITTRAIADQLRRIADTDGLTVSDEALFLIARAAEGSMRDAQSALDQVIGFAGQSVTVEDVTTVLGLVGRDLVTAMAAAVAGEDARAAFALVARAVESGLDLRQVCKELSRLVRDLLLVNVDPGRLNDPEIAADAERGQLQTLSGCFSREDLLRAFDVIARAEADIRQAGQPHYHLEMALLRWIHLRRMVPVEDLIDQLKGGSAPGRPAPPSAGGARPVRSAPAANPSATSALVDRILRAGDDTPKGSAAQAPAASTAAGKPATAAPQEAAPAPGAAASAGPASAGVSPAPRARSAAPAGAPAQTPRPAAVAAPSAGPAAPSQGSGASGDARQAFLSEIQKQKLPFYGMVVAQALRIEFGPDAVTFVFAAAHRTLREQVMQQRQWLEGLASRVAGRQMPVRAVQEEPPAAAAEASAADNGATADGSESKRGDLRSDALANPGVQAMLEMFPAEIRDVEEM